MTYGQTNKWSHKEMQKMKTEDPLTAEPAGMSGVVVQQILWYVHTKDTYYTVLIQIFKRRKMCLILLSKLVSPGSVYQRHSRTKGWLFYPD